jgi:hypothetical protein
LTKKPKMDADEFQEIIKSLAEEAENFVDGTLSEERALATKFYLGGALGNEEEGRSQFVLTIVRDSINAILPSFLRVVFGADRAAEFVPTNAGTVELAEQVTDYVHHVFTEDNNGFALTHGVVKDALIRKIGVYKWAWDDTSSNRTYALKDIGQSALEALVADESITLLRATPRHPGSKAITTGAPASGAVEASEEANEVTLQPAIEPTFDIEVKHAEVDGKPIIWALPPEEFIWSPDARDMKTAKLVGQRTEKSTSDLLKMGVKQDDIDEHGGLDETLFESTEELARRQVMGGVVTRGVESGDANTMHAYAELYPLVDFDGDGIAELRRVCTLGPGHHVVSNEPANSRPFATFCPDPEPHTMSGLSWADRLMDLQRFASNIIRANADSLSGSIFPRIGYVEGQVNPTDVLNTEMGGPIRMKAPGMIQPIIIPYAGKESFQLLEYLEGVKESRTGQPNGGMSLDADALQSTEKAAAGAAINAAQGQMELLVRIFAQGCLKDLLRGIYGLMIENRPKKKMVRLRGKWVEIDPRVWDANMDVTCNVALGTSLVEQKISALLGIAAKQELIISTYGPSNPVCSAAQYSHTLRRIAELSGFKDSTSFYNEVDPQWQPPAPQPQPDAAMAMVEVKKQELQLTDANAKMKMNIDAMQKHATSEYQDRQLAQELAISQEQIRAKMELGATELELKYKTQLAIENMKANVEGEKEAAKSSREAINQQLEHERTVADAANAHAQTMQKMTHDHAEKIATIKAAPKGTK